MENKTRESKQAIGFDGPKMVKNWMDKNNIDAVFNSFNGDGIYEARQPLYGFRNKINRQVHIDWYIITRGILDALNGIEFNSLLDVGAGEGFTAYLVRSLFGAEVCTSDFSKKACERCSELFGIRSIPSEGDRLPFKDGEFDVVLCSEALEHMLDLPKSISEIVRVAKKTIIITVPKESKELIQKNIEGLGSGSSHIHSFDFDSFDFLPYDVHSYGMFKSSVILKAIMDLVEARPRNCKNKSGLKKASFFIYNMFVPVFRFIFRERLVALLLDIDRFLCDNNSNCKNIVFVINKRGHEVAQRVKKRKGLSYWLLTQKVDFLNKG